MKNSEKLIRALVKTYVVGDKSDVSVDESKIKPKTPFIINDDRLTWAIALIESWIKGLAGDLKDVSLLIIVLVFIDKTLMYRDEIEKSNIFIKSGLDIYDVFISAAVIAGKIHKDKPVCNFDLVELINNTEGCTKKKLRSGESFFLQSVNFKLEITTADVVNTLNNCYHNTKIEDELLRLIMNDEQNRIFECDNEITSIFEAKIRSLQGEKALQLYRKQVALIRPLLNYAAILRQACQEVQSLALTELISELISELFQYCSKSVSERNFSDLYKQVYPLLATKTKSDREAIKVIAVERKIREQQGEEAVQNYRKQIQPINELFKLAGKMDQKDDKPESIALKELTYELRNELVCMLLKLDPEQSPSFIYQQAYPLLPGNSQEDEVALKNLAVKHIIEKHQGGKKEIAVKLYQRELTKIQKLSNLIQESKDQQPMAVSAYPRKLKNILFREFLMPSLRRVYTIYCPLLDYLVPSLSKSNFKLLYHTEMITNQLGIDVAFAYIKLIIQIDNINEHHDALKAQGNKSAAKQAKNLYEALYDEITNFFLSATLDNKSEFVQKRDQFAQKCKQHIKSCYPVLLEHWKITAYISSFSKRLGKTTGSTIDLPKTNITGEKLFLLSPKLGKAKQENMTKHTRRSSLELKGPHQTQHGDIDNENQGHSPCLIPTFSHRNSF